jgi:hypothetical protein
LLEVVQAGRVVVEVDDACAGGGVWAVGIC